MHANKCERNYNCSSLCISHPASVPNMCLCRVFLLWHKHHVLLDTNDDLNSLTRNRTNLFTCFVWLCMWVFAWQERFGVGNDFNQIVLRCINVAGVFMCDVVSSLLIYFQTKWNNWQTQTHRHWLWHREKDSVWQREMWQLLVWHYALSNSNRRLKVELDKRCTLSSLSHIHLSHHFDLFLALSLFFCPILIFPLWHSHLHSQAVRVFRSPAHPLVSHIKAFISFFPFFFF